MSHEDKKSIPRRQAKPRVKVDTKITAEQQEEIDKVVAAAVIQFQEQIETKRTKQKYVDLETIDTLLSEHVGPYILIGFNLNNEPIEIFNAKNDLEFGALTEQFKKVFVERAVRRGNDIF